MLSVLVSLIPGLAAPAAAQVAAAEITTGRAQSLVALAVGLGSVVLGARALARSARSIGAGPRPGQVLVALIVGLIAMVLAGLHLATSTGGIGSGSGRLGALVALAVGLIGTVLAGLALARSRRTLETR